MDPDWIPPVRFINFTCSGEDLGWVGEKKKKKKKKTDLNIRKMCVDVTGVRLGS